MPKKTVLIVDESELFRQYMKAKLERFGLVVETAINGLDGSAKIRDTVPDLVVLDYHVSRRNARELLEEKAKDPNSASAPVILTAQKIDKRRLLELVHFNVRRVFTKPIRIDDFYATLREILGLSIEVDETPCILEAHVNDDIVFVEIAQGFNREKIDLLRFKLAELLELYGIAKPRVLLLMSDLNLSFVDGHNLEALLGTILEATGARHRHVRVITNEAFVKDFVAGREEFKDIEVVSNLQYALDGLLSDPDPDSGGKLGEGRAQLVAERVLKAQAGSEGREALEMRFSAEKPVAAVSAQALRESWKDLKVAVVDDDFVIQEQVRTLFHEAGAEVQAFDNGRAFLQAVASREFDLVFLDILMPEKNGFDVLAELHARDIDLPVIVLSAVSQREAVIRAFQAGVRSYLVKPLGPDEMLRKTLEVLKANF